ncbi:ATP-binding protein [Roseovarius salinarum]|uniref:ATP-binding protein n=1 Tax=Roseovarius salinarum TaxID=1981892 RepID=UPI000C33463C|nr:ATP-binding protein [Roseovarius salinarum]
MSFRWLKSYMPRGLYWRAMLILLLPVLGLLLVVSVVFIQRHFEGVTEQMTLSTSREVALLRDPGAVAQNPRARAALAERLNIRTRSVPAARVPRTDSWLWYDLTGGIVVREFRRHFPDLAAVRLPDMKMVELYFDEAGGAREIRLSRRRVSASNPHQLFVNMVVFGVLMTAIAYIYLRNQLRPITRLAHAAEAFGKGRHVPYHPSGATEVRAAGQAFLDMRARIERQIEQRTLMLSGVSHDMRTPLTRLRLELSMLDEAERAPMMRDIAEMERLLDEFLAFARGAAEGEPVETDPVALVRQVVEDSRRAQVPVSLERIEGQGRVPLRRDGLRRALDNLINNAVRYGTRAEVSVILTDESLCIRVEDDGPGIPEEQRREALKPFARLEPARNQNRGTGVGLGLSIAADIARAHGGNLSLGESARLGGLRAEIVIAR